ncbi:hypothetical protein V6L77_00015 [Pannonibacter sp. Pt2-lr]
MFARTQADTDAISAEREIKIIDGIKQSIGDAAAGCVPSRMSRPWLSSMR